MGFDSSVKELKKQGYRIVDIAEHMGISKKTVVEYNKIPEEDKEKYDRLPMNELKKEIHKNEKWQLIQDVQNEYNKCHSISKVSNKYKLDARTVKKYLDMKEPPIHAATGSEHFSILDVYKPGIIQMVMDGSNYRLIYDKIKKDGYNGSESLLRTFISNIRKRNIEINKIRHVIERNALISLLYKEIDNEKNITKEKFNQFITLYPDASLIYEIIKTFKEIIFSKKAEKLDSWIKETKSKNIPEMNSFITGIERDIAAVENAIKYDYNNGLAEGTVNKIKVVKRIMYGRCSFGLLRQKLLLM